VAAGAGVRAGPGEPKQFRPSLVSRCCCAHSVHSPVIRSGVRSSWRCHRDTPSGHLSGSASCAAKRLGSCRVGHSASIRSARTRSVVRRRHDHSGARCRAAVREPWDNRRGHRTRTRRVGAVAAVRRPTRSRRSARSPSPDASHHPHRRPRADLARADAAGFPRQMLHDAYAQLGAPRRRSTR